MSDLIEQQRQAVVAEAKSWLGTPYHHMARKKGVGVDCAMLPAEVYAACGMIPAQDVTFYPADWHLHRGTQRYLERVLDYAQEINQDQVQPGDLVLWRFGRAWAHGAIVEAWPDCIHAHRIAARVVMVNAAADADLASRSPRFFTLWTEEL